jgi:dolichol-phosphate mannosyltransferase
MMTKCLVVIPTYNERENIGRLIPEILQQGPEFEVLVVDDNSPDGTAEVVAQQVAEQDGRVRLLRRPGKLGLGTAYIEGFRYGLAEGYDFLFEMDADFSHQPKYLPALLKAAQRTGVAVGSRNVTGGGVENWAWYRKLISRGGSLYAQLLLGLKVKDCTGGFKCFSRAVLQMINLDEVRSTGFGFQVEVNCLCQWQGLEVTEVPIIFPDRLRGKSKMNRKIFFEALRLVWELRVRRAELIPGYASSTETLMAGEAGPDWRG